METCKESRKGRNQPMRISRTHQWRREKNNPKNQENQTEKILPCDPLSP